MRRKWIVGVFLSLVCLFMVTTIAQASGRVVHVVQPGQTLYSISRWYGISLWTLANTNGIVNPNHIYVGQRLVIPQSTYTPPPPSSGVHIVKPGETLIGIASRYGVTYWSIAQANGLYNPSHIYVGQRLVIPGYHPAPKKPSPDASAKWRGEYHTGVNPEGGPLFVRYDPAVNFHWKAGSPDPRLPADEFSVHWTREYAFKGGIYRLRVITDDGVRIWVDEQKVLDAWTVQPETEYTVDVEIKPGKHVIAIDYFEASGWATVQFSFTRLGQAPVPTPQPTTTPSVSEIWYGEYFANDALAGDPAVTRMDGSIGFEWGTGAPVTGLPSDHFSVRWTKNASFYSDNYAFCAMSDDGVRLYIDDQVVLDEWHPSNSVPYCTEINMDAGVHRVKAEYYEDGGNALIYVWWERH